MKGDIITRIRAKVAASDPYWLALQGAENTAGFSCKQATTYTAATADHLPPVYAAREPVTYAPPGYIVANQGFGFYDYGLNLGVCYYAVADTDPTQAAKYKAQALKILRAATTPMAFIAPQAVPSTWSAVGVSTRAAYYISNTGAGGQARVYMYSHGLSNGATVTVSGTLGCTTANGTRKVANAVAGQFDLVDTDGSTPIICDGAGTNYNDNPASDSGYSFRVYGFAPPLLYDWFFSDLDSTDKTNVYNSVNAWFDDFRVVSSYPTQTMSNYHAGYFSSTGMIGILTSGAGENPRGASIYDYWRNTLYEMQDQPFFSRWLGNSAGFPEAIRYQTLSTAHIAMTLLTQKEANGEDLFSDFPWVLGLQKYWVHNTLPPRVALSYEGFIASPNDATGTNPNPVRDLLYAARVIHHIADVEGDTFRPKFKSWIDTMAAQNGENPGGVYWWPVVFWDGSLSSSDWTATEPRSLPQMSNPDGGYSRVAMRSDWTSSAVYADMWTGPGVSHAGNGKERYNKGTLHVQRGDVQVLVSPTAEATRAGNATAYNTFHGATYKWYGIWWPVRTDTGALTAQVNAYSAPYKQPGWVDNYPTTVVTQNPARMDRFEDATSYVYTRSVRLDEIYGWDVSNRPAQGWSREVLYIRPGVFVVYDRTRAVDSAFYNKSYYQRIAWNVGKTPTVSAYGSGLYRTDVVDGAVHKGAITHVLPAQGAPTATDLGGYGLVWEIDNQPTTRSEYVNWLNVVDTADSVGGLAAVAKLSGTNVDVVRIGTSDAVGFPSHQSGASVTLPLTYTLSGFSGTVTHRVAGLAASTTYNVSVSGNDVTIAASGGGSSYDSTAAGVLVFETGAGGTLAVNVTTSSPMPSGLRGVAYSQTLAATGGIGAPYTWTKTVGSFPGGLSLAGGVISGTPTTAESQTFTMQACDGDTIPTCGTKALTIAVGANAPVISTSSLPGGIIGQAYAASLSISGGVAPVTCDLSTGSMCGGLSLSSGCAITGTPTTAQVCSFTARATDTNTATGTKALSIQTAESPNALSIAVTAGSDSAVVHYRSGGLPYGTSCTETLYDGETPIQAKATTSGASVRAQTFSGLTPETSYGVTISCDWIAPAKTTTFTTKAASASGTYRLNLKPPALTLAQMTALDATLASATAAVYWQAPGEGSYTGSATACPSGCTLSKTSLASGVHSYYHEWIAGTAYATGAINWTNASYPSDGETVTVGSITYTFRSTVAQPFDVKIVPDSTEASYSNLWEAIDYGNWTPGVSPNAPGANYYATQKNPDIVRQTWSAPGNTATFRAAVLGAGGNSIPLSETSSSMTVTPLSGGTDAVITSSASRPSYVPIP